MADQMGGVTATPAASGVRGGAVVRAGVLSMVGLIALGGTRLIHGALVGRATDTETFGRVGALIGLAMAASLFLPGGLASAASRFIPFHRGAGDAATARRAYRVLTATGYAVAVAFAAIVAAIAATRPDVSTAEVLAAAGLTAVYSAYGVAKAALYGFDRVVPYTWLEIAGSVVAIGSTLAIVATGATHYLAPLAVGYAVLVVGSLIILRRGRDRASTPPAPLDRREVVSYVWLASIGGVASAGLLQALPSVAGWFTTDVEAAFVFAGVTLIGPLLFLPRALGLALFPAMARAQGAGDLAVVRRHLDVSTRALFALLAPLFAAGILLAPEALVLIFGDRYLEGAAVLRVLLLATFVASVQVPAINSLSSGSAFRIPAWAAVAGAVVGLAALVPLGRWLGASGVGLGYLIAVAVTTAVPLRVAWRRFDLAWAGPVLRSVAVVGAAMAAAVAVDAMAPTNRVVIDVVAALAVMGVGGLVLRRDITGVLAARHG